MDHTIGLHASGGGMTDYSQLFQPLELGPIRLKNRVVMSGHHMGLGDGQGGIGPRLHAYMVARAHGGAAMVGLESSPVHSSSVKGVRPHLFDDALAPGLKALADDVHAAGSRLSVILWHGGHNMTHLGAGPAWSPSVVPSAQFAELPKAMTLEDIDELVDAYVGATRRCRTAGLDAVEIQTSSDYLLGSFLNPLFNRRTDAYGGSLENRMRLIVRVAEAVRAEAGVDMAVGVRTSIAHNVPGDANGYGQEDSLAAMRILVDSRLVDYVSLITGSHFALADLMPTMTAPPAHLSDAAARFRAALGVPIFVAGSLRTPDEAAAVIEGGCADVVAMARPWIADPEWLVKVRNGDAAGITPCVSCNQACTFAQRNIGPATCVVNPRAGREFAQPRSKRGASERKLTVVGGGPAGLEAARRAAVRGLRVTLYEAGSQLGGAMRQAGEAPHRAPLLGAIEWWSRMLERLDVRVVYDETIGADDLPQGEKTIWAVGADPAQSAVWRRRPHLVGGIPGAETLIHGRTVLAGTAAVSGRVLIIDEENGWPTISLAETLAADRAVEAVTVATPVSHPALPELLFSVEAEEVMRRLGKAGIAVKGGATVKAVDRNQAVLTSGEVLGPFETIVLSTGTLPRSVPEGVLAIGDCVAPRGFWAATNDAMRLIDSL
jgi:2,4-dienoyl-CoA reductase-like NADH-dependent reductase (Old Yellow Enzyme family)